MPKTVLGVVGGSGVYDLPGLSNKQWVDVQSPFGKPSDEILFAEFEGLPVRFLPRHGRGHRLSPDGIDYRANIDALKRAGVTDLVSISAVGSLREELEPGRFVLVDQYVDRTNGRARSFFGNGLVAHVPLAEPAAAHLLDVAQAAADALEIAYRRGGTLVVIEGPQFSTRAESELYRQWGADVIGMTAMPEARLAREAEIAYATIAMVTDYDCWHPGHDAVDVGAVVQVLNANRGKAQALVAEIARRMSREMVDCPARRALDFAIMTAQDKRDAQAIARLDAVAGRVLRPGQNGPQG
ncbi:MAG TPA: S-methyl-5'-thioadenosine phosphorylase [Devosiaceae bacterium]